MWILTWLSSFVDSNSCDRQVVINWWLSLVVVGCMLYWMALWLKPKAREQYDSNSDGHRRHQPPNSSQPKR